MFEPLQLDSMQPDSYSSGASDDEYDETCDASAQVFSPRGAEGVDDLLEANPFSDSEGDNDEIESCEIDYTEETIDDTQKSQIRHSSSADLETIWNESGEDYDDKNAKGKKISRVWGLINKKNRVSSGDLEEVKRKEKERENKNRRFKDKVKGKGGFKRNKKSTGSRSEKGDEEGSPLSQTSDRESRKNTTENSLDHPKKARLPRWSSFSDMSFYDTIEESTDKELRRTNSVGTDLSDLLESAVDPSEDIEESNTTTKNEEILKPHHQKSGSVTFSEEALKRSEPIEIASEKKTNKIKQLITFANDDESSISETATISPMSTPKKPTKPQKKTKPGFVKSPGVSDALIFQLLPIKEGYLVHKRRRRWIILDKQNLYIFKSVEDFKAPKVINLHCSAVRRLVKEATPAFEIITSGRTFVFIVDKEQKGDRSSEISSWVTEIQAVCEKLVLSSIGANSENEEDNILSKSYSKLLSRSDILAARSGNIPAEQRKVIEVAVQPGNRVCADCGAKDPEWASINIGVFICIECSGIHRSFGTHISKVRSVKLDKWEPSWVEIMRSIGNERANKVWLYNVPPGMVSITENSNLEERKKWLTAKYVDGRFTEDWEAPEALADMKSFSKEFQSQFKFMLLKCLKEDPEFRNDLKTLLSQNSQNVSETNETKSEEAPKAEKLDPPTDTTQ